MPFLFCLIFTQKREGFGGTELIKKMKKFRWLHQKVQKELRTPAIGLGEWSRLIKLNFELIKSNCTDDTCMKIWDKWARKGHQGCLYWVNANQLGSEFAVSHFSDRLALSHRTLVCDIVQNHVYPGVNRSIFSSCFWITIKTRWRLQGERGIHWCSAKFQGEPSGWGWLQIWATIECLASTCWSQGSPIGCSYCKMKGTGSLPLYTWTLKF